MKFENMEDDFETSHLLYTQQKPGGAHQLHRKGGYSEFTAGQCAVIGSTWLKSSLWGIGSAEAMVSHTQA